MTTVGRTIIESAATFAAGTAILLLPVLSAPRHARYPAAFLPAVRDAVEGIRPISFLLLLFLGLVLGVAARASALLLAAAAVAVFPIWSVVDAALGGQSHNLLPLEWLFYGLYAVIVLIGLAIGRGARTVFASRRTAQ
jgi:hypothetical protein